MTNRNEQEIFAVHGAQSLLQAGDELIYLTHFGSVLYGTNSDKSDCDLKGVFLPSVESLIKGTAKHHYKFSSGANNSKNEAKDIDIELWSMQKWLNMLAAGDTGALDLLFSVYAKHVKPIVNKNFLGEFYTYPSVLFDITNNKSYIGYVNSQAKKYGIKGSRMGILKDVREYLESRLIGVNPEHVKAGEYFDELVNKFGHESYCFVKDTVIRDEPKILFLLGKGFCSSIKMTEMLKRIDNDFNKYGQRVKDAANNKNIDWKALSHALRCLFQVEEVLDTGFVQYPLKDAKILKAVKYGKYSWAEVETMILAHIKLMEEKLENIKAMTEDMKPVDFRLNQEKLLISHYKDLDFELNFWKFLVDKKCQIL